MRTSGQEAVHIHMLALAIAPDARSGLLVSGRIPVRIKQDKAVGANQIQATAAGFATEQEYKIALLRIIEVLNLHSGDWLAQRVATQLLSSMRPHGAV